MLEDDLDEAVIEKFGGSFSGDFVALVESGSREGDGGPAVFDVERRLHGAEGDFAMVASPDRDRRRTAEVEIIAIPDVGFDDPPAADQLVVRRRAHCGTARSLGSRTRL